MVRLCDKVVRTQIHAHQLIHLAVPAGHHNDGNLALPTYLPANMITVKLRQIDIQEDQMGISFHNPVYHVFKIIGNHRLIPVFFQQYLELYPDGFIVLHNKNTVHSPPSFHVYFGLDLNDITKNVNMPAQVRNALWVPPIPLILYRLFFPIQDITILGPNITNRPPAVKISDTIRSRINSHLDTPSYLWTNASFGFLGL